jgi:hypothetical protein
VVRRTRSLEVADPSFHTRIFHMTTSERHRRGPGLTLDAAAARLSELLEQPGGLDGGLEEARGLGRDLAAALPLRLTIERAKGVVMGARGLGEDEAFAYLRSLSQRANRPLRLVVEQIADSGRVPD